MRKSIHSPEYAAILAELKRARRAVGMTQRALSLKLRVPHSWVAKVEIGERRIDVIEFGWYMAACGVNPGPALSRVMRTAGSKAKVARRKVQS